MSVRAEVAVLVVAAAVLSGCSGSSSPAPAATSTSPLGTPSAPSASATPSAPSASATPSAASSGTPSVPPPATATAAVGECGADMLRVHHGRIGGAAGTYYLPIVFSNVGTQSCVLQGYPGVSFLDDSGGQIGSPADRDHSEPVRRIVLAPAESAHSDVAMPSPYNYSESDCQPAQVHGVRVYPPDETASTTFDLKLRICTTQHWARVSPVAPDAHG